jgi:hypothetical protein
MLLQQQVIKYKNIGRNEQPFFCVMLALPLWTENVPLYHV